MDILRIQRQLALFAKERDWDQFHSPKNLAMALTSEVGELAEIFQWLKTLQCGHGPMSHSKYMGRLSAACDASIVHLRIGQSCLLPALNGGVDALTQ